MSQHLRAMLLALNRSCPPPFSSSMFSAFTSKDEAEKEKQQLDEVRHHAFRLMYPQVSPKTPSSPCEIGTANSIIFTAKQSGDAKLALPVVCLWFKYHRWRCCCAWRRLPFVIGSHLYSCSLALRPRASSCPHGESASALHVSSANARALLA